MTSVTEIKAERAQLVQRKWDAERVGDSVTASECSVRLDQLIDLEAQARPARRGRMARHCNDRGQS